MSGEANAYVADLRAERDRLREVVRRVEGVAAEISVGIPGVVGRVFAICIRDALNASTPVESSTTDTGPAPAGAHSGSQGAGDGV